MGAGEFEIFLGKDEQYYFCLRIENGQIAFGGGGFVSKAGWENGVQSVKVYSESATHYERREGDDGEFRFELKADNNEIIGVSPNYKTRHEMESGMSAVMRVAPEAPIRDRT